MAARERSMGAFGGSMGPPGPSMVTLYASMGALERSMYEKHFKEALQSKKGHPSPPPKERLHPPAWPLLGPQRLTPEPSLGARGPSTVALGPSMVTLEPPMRASSDLYCVFIVKKTLKLTITIKRL